ncbi:hypothetical protein R1sor_005512 [Riccia sorocarpa]|uniref:Uncharacterized protein n=1 Tax=Riccia sorocarpa TaxID=122646 RepID=A0ABD3HLS3_9MARC
MTTSEHCFLCVICCHLNVYSQKDTTFRILSAKYIKMVVEIIGLDGGATVVGWQELERAFGAKHSEDDEFKASKIMHKQLLPYNPDDFLHVVVEKNANKELVSRKDYEEVQYYREATPYGPTYYLMSIIVELFWCNSRGPQYLTPMVYAYLLRTKYPEPIVDINRIRELCKLKDLDDLPEADIVTTAPTQGKKGLQHLRPNQNRRNTVQLPPAKRPKVHTTTSRSTANVDTAARTAETGSQPPRASQARGSVAPSTSPQQVTGSSSSDPYGSIPSIEDFCAIMSTDIQELLATKVTVFCSHSRSPCCRRNMMLCVRITSVKVMELQVMIETITKKIKELQEQNTTNVDEVKADNDRLIVKLQAFKFANDSRCIRIQELQMYVDASNNKWNISSKALLEKEAVLQTIIVAQSLSKGELHELHHLWISVGAMERLKVRLNWRVSFLCSSWRSQMSFSNSLCIVTASLNDYKHTLDKEVEAHTVTQFQIETLQDDLNSIQFKLESAEKARTTTRQELANTRA